MTIAETIIFFRKSRNLTVRELADAINVSPTAIALSENGHRTPSKEMAKRLSDYFKVPISAFLNDGYEPHNPQYTTIDNDLMIDIVDAVTEFLHENNLDISPDQRRELIKHFYGQNCHDVNRIREILSGMLALNSHAFGKEK